jgi:hypothetical protein
VTDTPTVDPSAASTCTIDEITLADDPQGWQDLGFTVTEGIVQVGSVRIAAVGKSADRGILRWSLRGIGGSELDGLPTSDSQRPQCPPAPEHPNGVTRIDHVVAMSPALDRTVPALQAAGLSLRRIREQPTPAGAPRQAFFRLGEVILEVVQVPDDALERAGGANGPTRFWGLALIASDLDATAQRLGKHISEIRPAVQPGRRIATLRRSAGLTIPVALMSDI